MPIDKLVPYAGNARTHSDAQVAQIAASIREFGWTNPVLIRDDFTTIAGHGRVLAARKLGLTAVPCLRLSHLTDAQVRAYVIADNKLSENAGWDDAILSSELKALVAEGFKIDVVGFSDQELNALLSVGDPGNTSPDESPEVPVEAMSKPGDVWILGRHRIICGDSLKRSTYETLLKDEKADLLLTDPPYGVAYHAGKKGTRAASIEGDLTQAAIPVSFALCIEHLRDDANAYLFGAVANLGMYSSLFDHYLRMQPRLMIWVKESFVLRTLGYHSQFELCFWGWKGNGGAKENWFGDRKQSDIWKVSRDKTNDRMHPTQKPVDLFRIPIVNSSPVGGIVLEPFSGSGTSIIACEVTGRSCRAIELSPHYVDVAILRWQKFTGKFATNEQTGTRFDTIKVAKPRGRR